MYYCYDVRIELKWWEGSTRHSGVLTASLYGENEGHAIARVVRSLPTALDIGKCEAKRADGGSAQEDE